MTVPDQKNILSAGYATDVTYDLPWMDDSEHLAAAVSVPIRPSGKYISFGIAVSGKANFIQRIREQQNQSDGAPSKIYRIDCLS